MELMKNAVNSKLMSTYGRSYTKLSQTYIKHKGSRPYMGQERKKDRKLKMPWQLNLRKLDREEK